MGRALLPGAAFVELALAAAGKVGTPVIEELTLQVPLLFQEEDACQIQLSVGRPDETGHRELAIYSRTDADGEWVQHAEGMLHHESSTEDGSEFAERPWPPEGAQEFDTEFFYDRLAEAGYDYGPAFRGLRRAYWVGQEIFAEVSLAEDERERAGSFGVHPALLDAALHTLALNDRDPAAAGELMVPFSFSGVRLYGQGASSIRVRVSTGAGDGNLSLLAVDEGGAPTIEIGSLKTRAIDPAALNTSTRAGHDSLHELQWQELRITSPDGQHLQVAALGETPPIPGVDLTHYGTLDALCNAIENGTPTPTLVLTQTTPLVAHDTDLASSVHVTTARVLSLLQRFLASERLQDSTLVVITQNALAITHGETPDLRQAALTGLLRTAHSEHPGRIRHIDTTPPKHHTTHSTTPSTPTNHKSLSETAHHTHQNYNVLAPVVR